MMTVNRLSHLLYYTLNNTTVPTR